MAENNGNGANGGTAAGNGRGTYTTEFTQKLNREQQRSMSERFLARAHPTEVALARGELELFSKMDEKERLSWLVRTRRGSNAELLIMIAATAGMYGAGKVLQTWFPFTWAGNVPVLPTVIGSAGLVAGFVIKSQAGIRFPLAMASVGLALGGGSVSETKFT